MNSTNIAKQYSETVEIYNQERPHLSYSFLPPNQMYQQSKIEIKTYKTENRSQFNLTSVYISYFYPLIRISYFQDNTKIVNSLVGLH